MTAPGQELELESDFDDLGLGDLTPSGSLPRVQINHKGATFKDTQTNEEFELIYGVPLGLIVQRIFWAKQVEDDSEPLCKSNDAETGYPNVTADKKYNLFPFNKAGIQQSTLSQDEYGRPVLACATCPFTQWGAEDGKRIPPPCSERYTIPILYSTKEGQEPDRAGIISFQRSGITPLKTYMSAFKRAKQPLFTSYMLLKLLAQKRGQVDFATPVVRRMGATDPVNFAEWAAMYREIRDTLRQPPRPGEDEQGSSTSTPAQAAPVQATVVPAQPTPQSVVDAASTVIAPPAPAAPVYAPGDDDLPF